MMMVLGRLSAFFILFLVGLLSISEVSARPGVFNPTNAFAKRVSSLPSRDLRTNAERLAVGLPPLKPRQMFNPTRVVARTPEPSPLPPISGRILVRKASTGTFLGYVSNATDNGGRYNVNTQTDQNLHLHVRFSPYALSSNPFNIVILPEGGDYPFLGFSGKNTDLTGFNPDVLLTATKQTPSGSTPVKVGTVIPGNSDSSESQIWTYDSVTTKIKANWVNPASPGKSSVTLTTEFYAPIPGPGSYSGIFLVKSGNQGPDHYQKVTLEISV